MWSRRAGWVLPAIALIAGCASGPATTGRLLRKVAQVPLPGGSARFDYAGLDSGRGLPFLAHMGAA